MHTTLSLSSEGWISAILMAWRHFTLADLMAKLIIMWGYKTADGGFLGGEFFPRLLFG